MGVGFGGWGVKKVRKKTQIFFEWPPKKNHKNDLLYINYYWNNRWRFLQNISWTMISSLGYPNAGVYCQNPDPVLQIWSIFWKNVEMCTNDSLEKYFLNFNKFFLLCKIFVWFSTLLLYNFHHCNIVIKINFDS